MDIEESVDEAIRAVTCLKQSASLKFIETTSDWIAQCFQSGNKILIAGNGGSLCDAMHIAEELTGQFRDRRKALPAIALSDPGHMTCTSNDMGFDQIFSRYVEALGRPGDLLLVLTTSGNSPNLVHAVSAAKQNGLKTIGFLGKSGGKLLGQCDLEWVVSGFRYSDRIQEAHMTAAHIIIERVEKILFYSESVVQKLVSV